MRKLNIGSAEPKGQFRRPEWFNIDASRVYRAAKSSLGNQVPRFAVASGCALPFRDETFCEIRAIHVLEHVPREFHLPFLREVRRTLTRDGSAFIEVPDILRSCQIVAGVVGHLESGVLDPPQIEVAREFIRQKIVGIYGKGRHEGDWHHWGFTPWHLEKLLSDVGLGCEAQQEMISGHFKMEPVLLYRAWRVDI